MRKTFSDLHNQSNTNINDKINASKRFYLQDDSKYEINNEISNNRLFKLIKNKDQIDETKQKEQILEIIKSGADINAYNQKGKTILYYAANVPNNVALIQFLIEQGANVNSICNKVLLSTPIFYAIANGGENNVKCLLNNGANVVANDSREYSALHFAITSEKLSIIRAILAYTNNVNTKNDKGITLLHDAIKLGMIDIVHILLTKGADIHEKYPNGQNPLSLAMQCNNKDIVKILINHKNFNFNNSNLTKEDVLDLAIKLEMIDVVTLLIDHGADVNKVDYSGYSPLHIAAHYNKNDAIVKTILSKAAVDINAVNEISDVKITPLLRAVCKKNKDIVKALISFGAKINDGIIGSAEAKNVETIIKYLLVGKIADKIIKKEEEPFEECDTRFIITTNEEEIIELSSDELDIIKARVKTSYERTGMTHDFANYLTQLDPEIQILFQEDIVQLYAQDTVECCDNSAVNVHQLAENKSILAEDMLAAREQDTSIIGTAGDELSSL